MAGVAIGATSAPVPLSRVRMEEGAYRVLKVLPANALPVILVKLATIVSVTVKIATAVPAKFRMVLLHALIVNLAGEEATVK